VGLWPFPRTHIFLWPENRGHSRIRARAHIQSGAGIFELHPGAAPCKNQHHKKIPRNLLVSRSWKLSPTSTRHQTAKMADSDSPVTLRTRKFIRNPLLGRKQMVV
jgi:hypothetical protein